MAAITIRSALIAMHWEDLARSRSFTHDAASKGGALGVFAGSVTLVTDPSGLDATADDFGPPPGVAVSSVPPEELLRHYGDRLAPWVVNELKSHQAGQTFLVCIAAGGSTAGFLDVDPRTGQLVLVTDPQSDTTAGLPISPPTIFFETTERTQRVVVQAINKLKRELHGQRRSRK